LQSSVVPRAYVLAFPASIYQLPQLSILINVVSRLSLQADL
jgi:hypothetical protein